MNFIQVLRFVVLPVLLVSTPGGFSSAWAQQERYKPGDKIEYLESRNPEFWEPGVYVESTPGGKQPIIRKKPNEFYKDGAQSAFDWERIRPQSAQTKPNPQGAPAAPAATVPVPATAPKPVAPEREATTAPAATASGLMTKEEVLGFLQARLGSEPFAHPQRAQIKQELAELIKRRGLAFRYENLSDFSKQLGKYGASSEVVFPLQSNFGPPTKQDWLLRRWSLGKIGATVDRKGNDGYIYRQTEIGVKNVGSVTIGADGKYKWQIDVPAGVARGEWRKARPEEMPYQGGDAIVLLKAKGGVDWIVHQDRVTTLAGDWVNVAQLDSRQVREGGFAEPKGK